MGFGIKENKSSTQGIAHSILRGVTSFLALQSATGLGASKAQGAFASSQSSYRKLLLQGEGLEPSPAPIEPWAPSGGALVDEDSFESNLSLNCHVLKENETVVPPKITRKQIAFLRNYASNPETNLGEKYVAFNDSISLYGSKNFPSVESIDQGPIGNCYFLAALAAVADRYPCLLRSHILYRGKNKYNQQTDKYKMRFYVQDPVTQKRSSIWVGVDTTFPENTRAAFDVDPVSNELIIYPALYEKAFAKLTTVYDIVGKSGYISMGRGASHEGFGALLPQGAFSVNLDGYIGVGERKETQVTDTLDGLLHGIRQGVSIGFAATTRNSTGQMLLFALGMGERVKSCNKTIHYEDGAMYNILIDRLFLKASDGTYATIVSHHAYTILQVDEERNVELRNPWGFNPIPSFDELAPELQAMVQRMSVEQMEPTPSRFWLSYRDFMRIFNILSVSAVDLSVLAAEKQENCASLDDSLKAK